MVYTCCRTAQAGLRLRTPLWSDTPHRITKIMHPSRFGRRFSALLLTGVSLFVLSEGALVAGASPVTRRDRSRSISSSSHAKNVRPASGCSSCEGLSASARGKSTARRRGQKAACHPKGYVDPHISRNFRTAMISMRRSGITPEINSAWRSSEHQAQLHSCSQSSRCRRANPGLYHALPPGHSLHEAAFAVDISGVAAGPRGAKRLTPRGRRIVQIMQRNGFKWRYGLADPAHFEADPRKYGYRTVKQAIKRTQSTCQVRLASASSTSRKTYNKPKGQPREMLRTSGKSSPQKRQLQRA